MKDELKDFVRRNREAFDDREPSEKVWASIDKSVTMRFTNSLWNSLTLWRAAAIVFMAVSIYLLIPKSQPTIQPDLAMKEFTDVEQYYIEQISQKTEMINEYQKQEGLNGFTQDFRQLEAMYYVLKEEMKMKPSKKVKDALVLNLLVRIDLLNQQLEKIDNGFEDSETQSEKPKSNV